MNKTEYIDFMKSASKNYGYIDKEFIPEEYTKIAICKMSLSSIPEGLRTKELSKIAVGNDGLDLQYVQKDYRTEELCKIAVNQNPRALTYVPDDILMKDQEICKMAIEKNIYATSKRISKEFLSENPEISVMILDKFLNLLEELSKTDMDAHSKSFNVNNLINVLKCLPEDFLEASEIIDYLKTDFQEQCTPDFNVIINSQLESLPSGMLCTTESSGREMSGVLADSSDLTHYTISHF